MLTNCTLSSSKSSLNMCKVRWYGQNLGCQNLDHGAELLEPCLYPTLNLVGLAQMPVIYSLSQKIVSAAILPLGLDMADPLEACLSFTWVPVTLLN